jgi:DNA-binding ferritin-like protein
MAKRLIENMEIIAFMQSHDMDGVHALYEQQLSLYHDEPFAELSVLLAAAQYVYLIHQTSHWQAKGDPFYGDHLLFERLYTATLEDIDAIAERSIGKGSGANVDLMPRIKLIHQHAKATEPNNVIPANTQLAERSMLAEVMFLNFAKITVEMLQEKGVLSRGVDQLIGGIEDKHEGHVYLLKQRLTND